jgi:hypothetical protein
MGSVHARGDTFLTFGLKALTETNTSRLATDIDDVLRELKKYKIHPRIKLSNNTTVKMLLYADDMLIIQENEDTLKKSMYELQKLSNNYNFNISTTKTKVMAFQGKHPIRSK